MQFIVLM